MTDSNLFQCRNCGFSIVAEELEIHQCKRIKEYRIIANVLWVTDGQRWYPLKLSKSPTRNEQQNRTTEGETEPKSLKGVTKND
jgi:hypothetical protein